MIMTSEPPAALLEGVYVANVTPFLDDDRYSIDPHAYAAHVRWLADHGVTGIVPFGTNGEGPSITAREKRSILEVLAATADLQIIASVAEANLPDTLDQLVFLDDLPVRAVMVMPPYYFKPVETEGLKIFYKRVLAATRHPVVLYHIPKYAIPIPVDLVISLPVWGVKDSGGEAGYARTLHEAGKGVLVGTEDDLPSRPPPTAPSRPWPTSFRSKSLRSTRTSAPDAPTKPPSCRLICSRSVP
jgi:4-hydroxy-tetrahydrodipicolinate synthase